jgi:oligopeptide transport system permease protein
MHRFILQRILWTFPVLFLVTIITFGMGQLTPGGPYSNLLADSRGAGRTIPPEIQANIQARYGLDQPVWKQYLSYMGQLIFHLDFGPSLRHFNRTVNDIVFGDGYLRNVLRERMRDTFGLDACSMTFTEPPGFFRSSAVVVRPNGEIVGEIHITWGDRLKAVGRFLHLAPVMVSAQIGIASAVLALGVGVSLGVLCALRPGSWVDHLALCVSVLGVSVPPFLLGIGLILIFALRLEWLPTYGWGDDWRQVILPAITLSTGGWPLIARLTRASMLDVMRADYVRTAWAKGLREQIVVLRHALRNALIPVVTILGPLVAGWLTGSFVVESVFSIGGIGYLFLNAVVGRDYSLIMGITLIYSTVLVAFNLLVDIAYGILDPRVRLE